jgi:hypothetical protein
MLNAGAYYVRVFPYSGSTNYNLSMSAVPNLSTVTVSATDASAAEVISGQTANPGTYRITRTGSTSSAVTVPYTMSGTASMALTILSSMALPQLQQVKLLSMCH